MIRFLRSLLRRKPSWYDEHLTRIWRNTKNGNT